MVEFLVELGYLDESVLSSLDQVTVTSKKDPIRVTCVGDSITAGVYPKLLESSLGSHWKVTNDFCLMIF